MLMVYWCVLYLSKSVIYQWDISRFAKAFYLPIACFALSLTVQPTQVTPGNSLRVQVATASNDQGSFLFSLRNTQTNDLQSIPHSKVPIDTSPEVSTLLVTMPSVKTGPYILRAIAEPGGTILAESNKFDVVKILVTNRKTEQVSITHTSTTTVTSSTRTSLTLEVTQTNTSPSSGTISPAITIAGSSQAPVPAPSSAMGPTTASDPTPEITSSSSTSSPSVTSLSTPQSNQSQGSPVIGSIVGGTITITVLLGVCIVLYRRRRRITELLPTAYNPTIYEGNSAQKVNVRPAPSLPSLPPQASNTSPKVSTMDSITPNSSVVSQLPLVLGTLLNSSLMNELEVLRAQIRMLESQRRASHTSSNEQPPDYVSQVH
ncbi:hypothetical protein AMATHDRAFT_1132 [Amanita thiersii Skay4041]|uniref:Uncharacterized protein n=1 Tax=Amanita thiersii Skay4041 TaxID=703135 RepID=A0A2A9NZG6_9AGAR|nr:hypothetical protein AMATHDRAFT_1132 [Amanita thiersii Skay4041]